MRTAAIVAAATIGDGVFALPFVFYEAGWVAGLFYLVVLGIFVGVAHVVYLKTLEKIGEKERLLGLTEKYFGRSGFWIGFVAIVLGLLLTLVAYLILGTQFIRLAVPSAVPGVAFLVFWLIISLPVLLGDRKVVDLELVGVACSSAVIVLIFATAWPNITFAGVPALNAAKLFLPFGAVLFALAGWTGVEPAYESRKKFGEKRDPWRPLVLGTFFAGALYLLFAAGILGSAPIVTSDTVSGLVAWPLWKKEIVAILGLLAVATVYLPISREVRNSLEKDLHWNKFTARSLIIFAPPALVLLGFNNFLIIIGLVGGLFISLQYLLIIFVGRRVLSLSPPKKFFLDLIATAFVAAAVYSLYGFVVH